MWDIWKSRFLSCLDQHAPTRKKRVGRHKSPWINHQLITKMHNRDFLKKKAEKSEDDKSIWKKYKQARNSVNNAIRAAKREYFTNSFDKSKGDMRKTLKNELSSRQCKSADISELKLNGQEIITCSTETAEVFNAHFTSIGVRFAREIPRT